MPLVRRVVRLGVWVVLAMVTQYLVNVADNAMVGRLEGDEATASQAALGVAMPFFWAFGGFFAAVGAGTQAITGRRYAESDYRGAFTTTLARFRRRSLLVVLTDLVEQAVGETLLPALPVIARSHLVIVAAVQDPEVVRWARSTPADGDEAYRKAAAVAALDERRRTTARLQGLGATVVDAPPGDLAPRLADAYLKVKATGRL